MKERRCSNTQQKNYDKPIEIVIRLWLLQNKRIHSTLQFKALGSNKQKHQIFIKFWLTHLIEDPRAEDCLKKVVKDKHVTKIQWLSVLHHLGAQHFREVGVRQTDGQCRERTAHHGPVVHAWICAKEEPLKLCKRATHQSENLNSIA